MAEEDEHQPRMVVGSTMAEAAAISSMAAEDAHQSMKEAVVKTASFVDWAEGSNQTPAKAAAAGCLAQPTASPQVLHQITCSRLQEADYMERAALTLASQSASADSRLISDKEAPVVAMAEAAPSVCQSKLVAVSTMAETSSNLSASFSSSAVGSGVTTSTFLDTFQHLITLARILLTLTILLE